MFKKFIQKSIIYSGVLIMLHVLLGFFANGRTDPFYLRFTSPKQTSLIIGGSRSAQGVRPEILTSSLSQLQRDGIYNFSFTITHSPYGETYYNAINKKLKKTSRDGTFIITVDPWTVSDVYDTDSTLNFRRENLYFLNDLKFFNSYPNYEYLLKYYSRGWGSLLYNKSKNMVLHDNGWLEVSVPMDSISLKERTESKLKYYRNKSLYKYVPSERRIAHLKLTIDLLNKYGTVYLIRLPVYKEMLDIENTLMPDFNLKMKAISKKTNIKYYDMTSDKVHYTFTDGNHLYKESAIMVTLAIAKFIDEN